MCNQPVGKLYELERSKEAAYNNVECSMVVGDNLASLILWHGAKHECARRCNNVSDAASSTMRRSSLPPPCIPPCYPSLPQCLTTPTCRDPNSILNFSSPRTCTTGKTERHSVLALTSKASADMVEHRHAVVGCH